MIDYERFYTGVYGLDDLFSEDCILYPHNQGMLMLIAGGAGTGKTLLSLEIAALNARRISENKGKDKQGMVFYFTIEQDPEELKKQIINFGWLEEKHILTFHDFTENLDILKVYKEGDLAKFLIKQGLFPPPGVDQSEFFKLEKTLLIAGLLQPKQIFDVPEYILKVIKEYNEAFINSVCSTSKRYRNDPGLQTFFNTNDMYNRLHLVVLDNFILSDSKTDRKNFREFRNKMVLGKISNGFRIPTILSIELPNGENTAERSLIEEYVANVSIRLGCRVFPDIDYKERYLEIIKARHQYFYRGKHHFSIISSTGGGAEDLREIFTQESRTGIHIYQSLSTRQSKLRKIGYKDRSYASKDVIEFGIKGFVNLFNAPDKGKLLKGSITSLVAEHETYESVIGLHFLAQGMKNISDDECVLLLSLDEDENAIKIMCNAYAELKSVILTNTKELKFKPNFKIHVFRPEFISASKFVHDIIKRIENIQDNGCNIKRIVIDNMAELALKFPLLSKSHNVILATLVDYFRTKDISALIIDVIESRVAIKGMLFSPFSGMVDNVILTRHYGDDKRQISVQKALGCSLLPPPSSFCLLMEERDKNGDLILSIVKSNIPDNKQKDLED